MTVMIRMSFACLAVLGCTSSGALAADTCKAQAAARSLHGAAETSFISKCTKDATAKCDADLKAKNLHGAAAASYSKKCVGDAAG